MELTPLERKVLKLLKEKGRMRYSEIHENVEISQGGLTRLLNRLVKKGLILREMEGTKYPPPVYYRINPEKEEEVKPALKEDAEESFMALVEFDPQEAEKLLNDLKKYLETLKK